MKTVPRGNLRRSLVATEHIAWQFPFVQRWLITAAVDLQVGLGELVPAVRHLVEYERNSLAAADTIAAAQGVIVAQPDVLLHRIVAQFQHLFDCPRLEGVLPALNQVSHSNLSLGKLFQFPGM